MARRRQYENWVPVPKGLPTDRGFPLYPDYSVYPSEIIAGYKSWPALCIRDGSWSFNEINPVEERFKTAPTLKVGDSFQRVLELLGRPREERKEDGLTLLTFSQDLVVFLDQENRILFLGLYEGHGTIYDTWDFLFVEPPECK